MIYISIDRHQIKENYVHNRDMPVIVIEDDNGRHEYVREVKINGPSRVVYRPNRPDANDHLSVAWVEVEDNVCLEY